jgi:hypothetical protein
MCKHHHGQSVPPRSPRQAAISAVIQTNAVLFTSVKVVMAAVG